MRLGGAERALIGLLNSIDYSQYKVDLFLFLHEGEMMPLIPKEVNILPENKKYAGMLQSVLGNLKQGNLDILYGKLRAKNKAANFIKKNKIGPQNLVYDNYLQREVLPFLPTITTEDYDLVISFLTPHYVATQKVQAKKRIAWIHTDYSFFEFDRAAELKMWAEYRYIASISGAVGHSFEKQFPELKSRLVEIENIMDPDFIHRQADAFSVSREMPEIIGEHRILSIGRFSEAKNFDQIPKISKSLLELGISLRWYLIGYGDHGPLIRQRIAEAGMERHVIILGKKKNPYPYLKACDVYIQPSRFEGKAVTVREAQILAKPVVITNFSTAKSQLSSGVDGWIVPMETTACVAGIAKFLQDKKLQQTLIENCQETDFGNRNEVQKIYRLME